MDLTTILASAAIASACPSATDAANPGDLHRQWILQGWERQPGDPPFAFAEKLGRFYSAGDDLHLYDSYDPQQRVARNAREYAGFWEGPFNALRSARHAVSDGPDVIMRDGIAATTLEFVARLEPREGQATGVRARSSLVWRCEAGSWRIVREQNAVREVPAGEVDAVLAQSN